MRHRHHPQGRESIGTECRNDARIEALPVQRTIQGARCDVERVKEFCNKFTDSPRTATMKMIEGTLYAGIAMQALRHGADIR